MKGSLAKGELLLRARVAREIDEFELKSKYAWKHPKGSLYQKFKTCYYITAVYSFLVFLLNELVFFMLYGTGFDMTDEQVTFFSNNHWVVHSMFLLAVIAFVLMCIKKEKWACRLQTLVGALMIFQVFQVFNGLYANQALLGGLYLFALLPVICAVGMLIINMAYNRRINNAVEQEIQKLYRKYDKEDGLMSSAEWEAILEQYENDLLSK